MSDKVMGDELGGCSLTINTRFQFQGLRVQDGKIQASIFDRMEGY